MAAQVLTFSPSSTPRNTLSVGSSNSSYTGGNQMQSGRAGNAPRSVYNPQNNGYRGVGITTPVPSYAFVATPALNSTQSNPLRQHPAAAPGHDFRSASASTTQQRPLSTLDLNAPSSQNSAKPSPDRYRRVPRQASGQTVPTLGSAVPSGSGMAAVGHLYHHNAPSLSSPALQQSPSKSTSTDDFNVNRYSGSEQAKRYRRRSINTIGSDDFAGDYVQIRVPVAPAATPAAGPLPRTYAAVASASYVPDRPDPRFVQQQHTLRPSSAHDRTHSNESSSSSVGSSPRPRSAKRETGVVATTQNNSAASSYSQHPTAQHGTIATSNVGNVNKPVPVPPRGSSDANKRLANPSPLSHTTMGVNSQGSPSKATNPGHSDNVTTTPAVPESPAAKHLAALNKKEEQKKGTKQSRLRRAFSFGSAAELRKASAVNNHEQNERAKLHKEQYRTDEEAREAAIVQQQEAAGLGASIYSGQGNFFTGSTDNLSVSSTASSASIMLRKMGKGMKRGSKSFVGLFRPKSVIGVPAADAPVPAATMAQVSMVTVEAEREKVNVNAHPHQTDGGTGFPKLERNSIDVARSSLSEGSTFDSGDSRQPRRSIVGGERERAEVLAAVKKGILKRGGGTDSGASSPSMKPIDLRPASEYILPQLPRFSDSPVSSTPSTPKDEGTATSALKRTDSVNIEGDDYFINARLAANGIAGNDGVAGVGGGSMNSLPGTPMSGSAGAHSRGITFSPKIQFHDTWPSGEYDRRGDIATCNRLTPTLAQQIKEELNSFKMEMEVHESSKVYTQFF